MNRYSGTTLVLQRVGLCQNEVHQVKSPTVAKLEGRLPDDEIHYTTLADCLAEVKDPRDKRGQQFEWLFLLMILCLGLSHGQTGVRGIAQ